MTQAERSEVPRDPAAARLPDDAAGRHAPAGSVRRRLVVLVLSVLLPMAGISLIAAYTLYTEQRHAVTNAALETAKALSLVADRELAHRTGALQALAASPAIDHGDLASLYAQARRLAGDAGDRAVILSSLDGRQLLNTRRPLGAELPPFMTSLFERDGTPPEAPVVSSMYMAPLGQQLSFAVRVPVMRDGEVKFHLTMSTFASTLQRIFEQQPLPAGWTGTLLDGSGRAVARNVNAERHVGKLATPDMLERLASSTSGVHETRTLDGTAVVTVYQQAPDSRWWVLIGVPRAQLQWPTVRALGGLAISAALLTAIAVLAAMRVGRGIAEPLNRLRGDAEALRRGQRVPTWPTGLQETDVVQEALSRASRELLEADERLQRRVKEAVEETERAQRTALSVQKLEALGRLTGGIAHDFNNLLQTMTTGLKLATMLSTDGRAQKALASCERAVQKAVRLTRELMTFGSSQPGHREVVDLHEQLRHLDELLRGALRESIAVRIDVPADCWPVDLDPVQLELAVLNLALNARDAIEGQGEVTVSARNRTLGIGEVADAPAGDVVALSVQDDGRGIAPEVLSQVFEPFFTTKPVGKGAGLGLAQVYGFVKQLGGGVSVDSRPGEGTRFTLWLPRSTRRPRPRTVTAPMVEASRFSGTVLLVEDDALVRGLTGEALERSGFQVLVAASVDDALALVQARPQIDAVLSDVVMPGGKSGIDLRRTLRETRPGLPVVLASGYADALGADADGVVIAKPYDVMEVARLLAAHIAARG